MINGIINVYKEQGFTSFDVVAKLRSLTRQKKIGHTGTLDPEATGVLPVCFGNATKLVDYLTDKTKEYETTLRLGTETDTQDIWGNVTRQVNMDKVDITQDEIINTIMSFVGKQQQIPPMYSAIKINGKKLYELAREGVEVERAPRDIEIFGIEIKNVDMADYEIAIAVECSKGTYIRTLCYDIGRKLGCGAVMTSLKRTRSGSFKIQQAYTLGQIEEMLSDIPVFTDEKGRNSRDAQRVKEALETVTMGVDEVFAGYEAVTVSEDNLKRVQNGNYVNHDYAGDYVRIYDDAGRFLALYSYNKRDRHYIPHKMFLDS